MWRDAVQSVTKNHVKKQFWEQKRLTSKWNREEEDNSVLWVLFSLFLWTSQICGQWFCNPSCYKDSVAGEGFSPSDLMRTVKSVVVVQVNPLCKVQLAICHHKAVKEKDL